MAMEIAKLSGASDPDRPAIIIGDTGQSISFAALDAASSQAARLLASAGLSAGDRVALCLPNGIEFLIAACGIIRSGLYVVPISNRLTASEIDYIIRDAGAKAVLTSQVIGKAFADLPLVLPDLIRFATGGTHDRYRDWDEERAAQPDGSLASCVEGGEILYSSGTTGRPKGIDRSGTLPPGGMSLRNGQFALELGATRDDVYLCPAPLYHSAPFGWTIGFLRLGATVVIMERFDAERALSFIDKYKVSVSQWVPTHFVRMLKLDPARRDTHNLSSQKLVIHAAAPCPVPVKHAMIDWWGPIIVEYYGSSEQSLLTLIDTPDWLAHPGSVGRCKRGVLHICDEKGDVMPSLSTGQIYCDGGVKFEYRNDTAKTLQSRHAEGWTTVGDMGYLDADGYLYLTDRKDFMIISGGVNIYPQEIENLLVDHAKIADAAVIGLPDDDLGERVTAVIQLVDPADATLAFAAELRDWMRQTLSPVKVPKDIKFRADLPRLPTGKMVKHLLRQDYADMG